MTQKAFSLGAGSVFLIVALLHLARSLFAWDVVIGGWEAPMWLSWVAVVVAGFLAYQGLRRK